MIFCGVFSIYHSPGSEAAMGGGRGTYYDIYDNKRAALHFRGFFFFKWNFHIILISPKGTAKLRWAGWGAEDIIFLGYRVAH